MPAYDPDFVVAASFIPDVSPVFFCAVGETDVDVGLMPAYVSRIDKI